MCYVEGSGGVAWGAVLWYVALRRILVRRKYEGADAALPPSIQY